jgi:tetratricopeptide (TPR) repeat protein
MQKTLLRQKLGLIFLGFFLWVVLLETGMRIGGFILSSLQEYRNTASIRKKSQYRIMCLGESTTALGGKSSYPRQLEVVLNGRNVGVRFSVINKGRPGIKTLGILNELESNINQFHPDIVLTMIGVNDYGTHIPYENTTNSKIFFQRLKIYKLFRLLQLHIAMKTKELKLGINNKKILKKSKYASAQPINQIQQEHPPAEETPQLDPKIIQAKEYFKLAWNYLDQLNYPESEKFFKKAIELTPDDDELYRGLGWCYNGWRRVEDGEACFIKAIELDPKNADIYVELGRYYLDQREYHKSEAIYKKGLDLDPKREDAYWGLGWCYNDLGLYAQAEEAFKKAVELNPNNPQNDKAYGGIMVACMQMGKLEEAEEYRKKATAFRLAQYDPEINRNYKGIKKILDNRGIKLVCVQYPMRSVEPLKKIFEGLKGAFFVDNEKIFKEAVQKGRYEDYFDDIFGGDFGHCNAKGNKLLAESIANVILKEVLHKQ